MIERDLKVIKERQKTSRTKTSQELKSLSRRQASHEKYANKQFASISLAIEQLPTQDVITKTIQDTIKVVVNGKIDAISTKVDMVGEHLKQQDANLEALSNKIKPIDGAREWLSDTGKVILYVGAIALALAGVIEVLQLIHIIK